MFVRLALIVLIAFIVVWLVRTYAPRLTTDPRARAFVHGLGVNALRLFLLRQGLPVLSQGLRFLRAILFRG